jgi:hypothetical protein
MPGNRFLGATSVRRRTAGLEGIHWAAAFLVGAPPLSRVFQVAHVKPANATNRLISPGRWIFLAFEEIRISYGNREKKRLICVAIFNPGEANPFATRGRRVLFAPLQPPETNQRSSANTLYSLFKIDNLQQRGNVNQPNYTIVLE